MPGPESGGYRPPETRTRTRTDTGADTFTMPGVTPPEQQQVELYRGGTTTTIEAPDAPASTTTTELDLPPLPNDVVVPNDVSALDPITGEVLHGTAPAPVGSPEATTAPTTAPESVTEPAVEPTDSDVPTTPDTGKPGMDVPKFRVVMAGLDKNIDQMAREAALEELEAEKIRKGPLWKHMVKRVWHTLTSQYQVVKRTRQKREEILENENLRHHQGKSDERWRESTVNRMTSDMGEELMRQEVGESYNKIGAETDLDPDSPEFRVRTDMMDLMRRHTKGEFVDKESFEAAQDEMVNQWRLENISQELMGEARIKATNMFAMAEQIKAAVDAAEGMSAIDKEVYLESILSNTEIVLGEAHVGSVVEIKETLSERLAEKMRGTKWVNEERMAGAASLLGNELFVAGVLSVALALGKKSTHFIPGLGAAVVAGFRERRAIIDQRAMAGRRHDNDQTAAAGNKRQQRMEEFQYESRSAGELLDTLSELYDDDGELNITTREELNEAIRKYAEVKARLELYWQQVPLIDFADVSSDAMGDRRFDVEAALSKLDTDMKKVAAGMLEADESFTDTLQAEVDRETGAIRGGMEEVDKLFNKFLRNQVLKKVLIAGVTAAAFSELLQLVGEGIQDVVHGAGEATAENPAAGDNPDMTLAANTEHIDNPSGAGGGVDHPTGAGVDNSDVTHPSGAGAGASHPAGGADTTHPAGAGANPAHPSGAGTDTVDHPSGAGGGTTHPDGAGTNAVEHPSGAGGGTEHPSGAGTEHPEGAGTGPENLDTHSVTISDHAKVNLPNGYNAETVNGHVTVTGPDGQAVGVDLDQNGTLPQSAVDELHQHGLDVTDHKDVVEGPPQVTHETVTSNQFVENHQDQMQKVKVVSFMDNNTPKSNLNELGEQHGINPDGSVTTNIHNMTVHGSFHNGQSVNVHEAAAQGKLVESITVGEGSQAHAFIIHFDAHGNAVIPNDSPARALFDEHGNFHGQYDRVAVEDGVNPDGSVRLISIATDVGSNSSHFTDTVSTPTFNEVHTYTVTLDKSVNPVPKSFTPTDVPPVSTPPIIPVFPTSRFGPGEERTAAGAATRTTTLPPAAGGAGTGTESPTAPPRPRRPRGGSRRPGGPTRPAGAPRGSTRPVGSPPPAAGTGRPAGAPGGPESDTSAPGATAPGTPDSAAGAGAPGSTPPPSPDTSAPGTSAPDAGDTSTPPPPPPPPPVRTPGEQIIDQVEAENRTLPSFIQIDRFDTMPPLTQKMIIRMTHEVMDRLPIQPGEDVAAWRARVAQATVDTGNVIGNAPSDPRITVPPEVQSLFADAAAGLAGARLDTRTS